eukprot:Colp12_sorted_trinity150504_noHs@6164
MMAGLVTALLVLLACLLVSAEFDGIQLHVDPKTRRLIDQYGRERLFRGTNVVYKRAPWMPSTGAFDSQFSFGDEDMRLLRSMGYNSIRPGVLWAGVEPEEGVYNETFLAAMYDLVEKAGRDYGIYS